jgi:hypothetical protein
MDCFVEERSPLLLGARKLTTISFCEKMCDATCIVENQIEHYESTIWRNSLVKLREESAAPISWKMVHKAIHEYEIKLA